jgi:uncharacterized membrane protein YgdD (TMEM256/DUF423 family)
MDVAKLTLVTGALAGAIGVGLGAFGAHALRDLLVQNNRLDTFQTATHYLQIHALALVLVGILMRGAGAELGLLQVSALGFTLGLFAFSGSLYVLALANLRFMGAIAPLGGLAFIVGWLALGLWALRA